MKKARKKKKQEEEEEEEGETLTTMAKRTETKGLIVVNSTAYQRLLSLIKLRWRNRWSSPYVDHRYPLLSTRIMQFILIASIFVASFTATLAVLLFLQFFLFFFSFYLNFKIFLRCTVVRYSNVSFFLCQFYTV